MVDLFLNKIVPIFATFWIVGGAIGLAFVIGFRLLPGPVEIEGSDELADERKLTKTDLFIGGAALFFLVFGSWLRWGGDPQLKGVFLICVSVAGTVIAARTLWPELRRRSPPLEPGDDEQLIEDQSEFEGWAQREAAADLEPRSFYPSHLATHRDKAGNLICRIKFARKDGREAICIAERDPNGINRIHVRSAGLRASRTYA